MPVRHIALIVEVEVDRQQSAELDERPYLVRGQIQEHLQLMYPTQQLVVSGFQVMDGPNPTHVLIDKDSVLAEDMAKHGHVPDGVFPEAENLTEITDEERVSRRAIHQKFKDALKEDDPWLRPPTQGVSREELAKMYGNTPQGRHGTRPINSATPSTAAPTPPTGGSGQSCQSSEELPRPDRPDNVTSIGKAREKRRWKGKR